jgi:hypothetical protein
VRALRTGAEVRDGLTQVSTSRILDQVESEAVSKNTLLLSDYGSIEFQRSNNTENMSMYLICKLLRGFRS